MEFYRKKKLQDFPGGMGTLLAKFPDISRFPEIPETLTAYKVSMFLQYSLFLGDVAIYHTHHQINSSSTF